MDLLWLLATLSIHVMYIKNATCFRCLLWNGVVDLPFYNVRLHSKVTCIIGPYFTLSVIIFLTLVLPLKCTKYQNRSISERITE